jgi:hypothetical protein
VAVVSDLDVGVRFLLAGADEVTIAGSILGRTASVADPTDHYAIGIAVHSLLDSMEGLTAVLHDAVRRYGDTRILSDDQNSDPMVRVETAAGDLSRAHKALQLAVTSIRAYNGGIAHLAVDADLDAQPTSGATSHLG